MNWVNVQYKSNLRKYEKKDGMKALVTYCLIMCSAFFQGWLYTTNANVFVLNLSQILIATVYKGNIIKNLIMDCQSYTKYRPNETTGGIFVSWRRKEELPTGA